MGRQVRIVGAGGGDDENAGIIKRVYCFGPSLRRHSTHAHCHDVNERRLVTAQTMDVVQRFSYRAVSEQYDPVRHPDRYYFGVGRAPEPMASRHRGSYEDAERSPAMAEIVQDAA